jgi:hypothetical protein
MFAQSFRCLFLGENPCWLKITAALAHAPFVSLTVQRASSAATAFSDLSTRSWDALALDLHASNFHALDSIHQFRPELPSFPIFALFDPFRSGSRYQSSSRRRILLPFSSRSHRRDHSSRHSLFHCPRTNAVPSSKACGCHSVFPQRLRASAFTRRSRFPRRQ